MPHPCAALPGAAVAFLEGTGCWLLHLSCTPAHLQKEQTSGSGQLNRLVKALELWGPRTVVTRDPVNGKPQVYIEKLGEREDGAMFVVCACVRA